jgi:hypothetical protein
MERGIQNDVDIVIHQGNHHPTSVVDHVHVHILFLQLGRDMFRDHLRDLDLDLGLGRSMVKKGIPGGDIFLGVLVFRLIGCLMRLVRMMGSWMGTCRVVYISRGCSVVITYLAQIVYTIVIYFVMLIPLRPFLRFVLPSSSFSFVCPRLKADKGTKS